MAAVTTRQAPTLPPPSGRAGFGGTLRSEFTKIRSVRSTYWTLLVLLVISVGIGAAICAGTAANWNQASAADRATFDATQVSDQCIADLYAFTKSKTSAAPLPGSYCASATSCAGMPCTGTAQ